MNAQQENNYQRIAKAITYIRDHYREQPSLDEIADSVAISPHHFQRMFSEWAGVSPKKFLQYITVAHAKRMLQDEQATLFDAAFENGLSGTSRLHDLFITLEGMTPGEYKNGGESLAISYSFAETPFGTILVASTEKGICHMAFADDPEGALQELYKRFPRAQYRQITDLAQQNVLQIFRRDWSELQEIKLHLKGTPFQLRVWEALLKIPMGRLTTYGRIAASLDQPTASRAVGSAVGDNPVTFLIPCHRVIQSTGVFGEYHWGAVRKTAMIGWEAAQNEPAVQ
ncbi:MAG: methylated-DNA--[protein]-cysteine S-methyltransferase [Mucilaginibacter polytrichastri]|nr:methylated-DNA--[protein]-cysteine S-methyltransferase [Mucilaginibacter polytrichastri]